ncbi:RNA polymerase sigma-70 factor (ECF subfamily) [Chitinophaga niastensis]|uniref:RNA polymerase sigma-70 factor (ECF subfamily) n=1 Tax=Chitinophaga niastensis TaxID=536980 RepID=A0A2P8HCF6_CHINA|nr:RNA polymerase sigma-70 factor [Chitinophaga niastensis]PSL43920.1 RNA polymerase sigma-70 factor (ECF subfamily) [Chitinophaga niastensis]
MAGYSDERELIQRISTGDRQAFTMLYTQYLDGLYQYIYLFTRSRGASEEIIQDTFVKIWERRESLEEIQSFKAYLYRAAKNLLLDEIRRNQVATKVLGILKQDTEESPENADDKIIFSQYYQIAQEAINLLPEKRKLIVELRTRDHLTLDEIAEKLSISKSVVKKQLYAGMSFVRKYLYKYGELTATMLCCISLLDVIHANARI